MTILLIDPEHRSVAANHELAKRHQAHLAIARSRLAAIGGTECRVWSYVEASPVAVERLTPVAVVIGGSSTGWDRYEFSEMTGLFDLIRTTSRPLLGICAGHQLIGRAYGAPWGPLTQSEGASVASEQAFGVGKLTETGYLPLAVDPSCPLFAGLQSTAILCQSHYWQLTAVPPGFTLRASTPVCPVQAIEHQDRPLFGVQFHPERYDDLHPAGHQVLRNFIDLARDRSR